MYSTKWLRATPNDVNIQIILKCFIQTNPYNVPCQSIAFKHNKQWFFTRWHFNKRPTGFEYLMFEKEAMFNLIWPRDNLPCGFVDELKNVKLLMGDKR